MQVKIIYILCIVFSFNHLIWAEKISKNLNEIFCLVTLNREIQNDTLFVDSTILKTKSIILEFALEQTLSHIGISLFSKETKELINKPVCDFIERLMLEAVLCKNKEEVSRMLESRKIEMRLNGFLFGEGRFTSVKALLEEINQPSSFRLMNKEGKFMAVIDFGVFNTLELTFTASRELIFGTDKKESDEEVYALLKNYRKKNEGLTVEVDSSALTEVKNPLYVVKGAIFMIDSIRSDRFFLKKSDVFIPFFEPAYPIESFKNLLLGVVDTDKDLFIRHRMYGNYSPDFAIPLSDFLECFKNDCSYYCGIHRMQNGKLQGVLIIHSKLYNFIHMLIVTVGYNELFESKTLNADLYTNVPQHYIKNLF